MRTCAHQLLWYNNESRQSSRSNSAPYLQSVSLLEYGDRAGWQVHWRDRTTFSRKHTSAYSLSTRTRKTFDVSACLHWSRRKWVFPLTSRSVSLQHVVMATGDLLKELTASHRCQGERFSYDSVCRFEMVHYQKLCYVLGACSYVCAMLTPPFLFVFCFFFSHLCDKEEADMV